MLLPVTFNAFSSLLPLVPPTSCGRHTNRQARPIGPMTSRHRAVVVIDNSRQLYLVHVMRHAPERHGSRGCHVGFRDRHGRQRWLPFWALAALEGVGPGDGACRFSTFAPRRNTFFFLSSTSSLGRFRGASGALFSLSLFFLLLIFFPQFHSPRFVYVTCAFKSWLCDCSAKRSCAV